MPLWGLFRQVEGTLRVVKVCQRRDDGDAQACQRASSLCDV